jgi:uncharacterized protein (DUF2384 family)
MNQPNAHEATAADVVLTKAVLRAADNLSISQKNLSRILGVSAASVSRLGRERTIAPASKEGELALLFLRVVRSLDAVVGGSEPAARQWLRAENRHLGGVPADLLESVTGLAHVAEYLDAMRGRL